MDSRVNRIGNGGARRWLRFAALIVLPLVAACDDSFGPQTWDATPDTVTVYSISRPDLLGMPSAFDFVQFQRVTVESPAAGNRWDFVLAEQAGQFVMLPASAIDGLNSRAGIAPMTATTLEAVREAPSDTASYRQAAVPIEIGGVYVVRSRREACNVFGSQGVRYGKLMALSVDASTGTFRFAVVGNPFCNNRSLVPPEDD